MMVIQGNATDVTVVSAICSNVVRDSPLVTSAADVGNRLQPVAVAPDQFDVATPLCGNTFLCDPDTLFTKSHH
jgi:hypothetical protein